jgi:tetratricopeptide (TPR) repeat protein
MTSRVRDLDPGAAQGPAEYVDLLRRLTKGSGYTYRQLQRRATAAGDVLPHSTLATMLSRRSLPREALVAALVRACGGDPDEVRRWLDARRRIATGTPGPPPPGPGSGPVGAAPEVGAPAGATPRTPRQLPADIGDFIGRTEQLRALDSLLGEGRPATATVVAAVVGVAGMGKTALAVHWAHRVADRFPDGQLYLDLRGYSANPPLRPIDALAALLRRLGVPGPEILAEAEEAAGLYRSILYDKRMLILLDNARDAEQVRPLLPGGRTCLVLITSRERLDGLAARDGARRITVSALATGDAVALLDSMVGHGRIPAEPDAAATLARLCARTPLALRITATHLANESGRSVAGHAAALAAGDRLAALHLEGDPAAAVTAAFDASYDRLTPTDRRLFRMLGVAPVVDFTAPAVAALMDVPPSEAGRLLDRLAGAHLITPSGPGRYEFHDLLRLHAAQRAAAEDEQGQRVASTRRLLSWYLEAVHAADCATYPLTVRLPIPPGWTGTATPPEFPDHVAAHAWLEAERHNLVAAIREVAANGPGEPAWLLTDWLGGYFRRTMHMVEWLTVADAALAAAAESEDLRVRAAVRQHMATALHTAGRGRESITWYREAAELARRAGWEEGLATVLGALGCCYGDMGELRPAAETTTAAYEINRRLGAWRAQAMNLHNLGHAWGNLGQVAKAARYIAEALRIDREYGVRDAEPYGLSNLGSTHHLLGELDRAIAHQERAVELFRAFGDRYGEGHTLASLAEAFRDAGRDAEAAGTVETAIAIGRDTGDQRLLTAATSIAATIRLRVHPGPDVVTAHLAALELARRTGDRFFEASILVDLSDAHRVLGQLGAARARAVEALTAARAAGFRLLEGRALTALAAAHAAGGGYTEAAALAEEAVRVHRETGHRQGEAAALRVLGETRRRTGQPGGAAAAWRLAERLYAGMRMPEAARVRDLLAELSN